MHLRNAHWKQEDHCFDIQKAGHIADTHGARKIVPQSVRMLADQYFLIHRSL